MAHPILVPDFEENIRIAMVNGVDRRASRGDSSLPGLPKTTGVNRRHPRFGRGGYRLRRADLDGILCPLALVANPVTNRRQDKGWHIARLIVLLLL
jgi:hypothetical protein